MAAKTTASNVNSESTATITRSPGRPYGIHVNTCSQARNAAPNRAGQTTGNWTPKGRTTARIATTHTPAIATEP